MRCSSAGNSELLNVDSRICKNYDELSYWLHHQRSLVRPVGGELNLSKRNWKLGEFPCNGNMGSLSFNCSDLFTYSFYTKYFVSVCVAVNCFQVFYCVFCNK